MTFHTNVNNIVDYQCKNFNKNDWKKYDRNKCLNKGEGKTYLNQST